MKDYKTTLVVTGLSLSLVFLLTTNLISFININNLKSNLVVTNSRLNDIEDKVFPNLLEIEALHSELKVYQDSTSILKAKIESIPDKTVVKPVIMNDLKIYKVLIKRNGLWIIDMNTFHEYTVKKNYQFSINKNIYQKINITGVQHLGNY